MGHFNFGLRTSTRLKMLLSRLARPSGQILSRNMSTKLARPEGMKGALVKQIGKNMIIAGVLATIGTYAFYIGVVKARRDVYAEFHRTVDPDAMYERMKSKGVFWAVKAIDEWKEEQAGEAEEGEAEEEAAEEEEE